MRRGVSWILIVGVLVACSGCLWVVDDDGHRGGGGHDVFDDRGGGRGGSGHGGSGHH
jgi:hypothetical protein